MGLPPRSENTKLPPTMDDMTPGLASSCSQKLPTTLWTPSGNARVAVCVCVCVCVQLGAEAAD